MKGKIFTFFTALFMFVHAAAIAQTTISTTGYTGNGTGSASPPPAGVSFSVTNTNSGAIVLTDVGYSCATAAQTELWYSATSLTGSTGPIISTSTAWTLLATVPSPTTVTNTTITNNFFTGLTLVIPASTTYRFAVVVNGSVRYYSSTPSQTVFSASGVNLDCTNTLWGGASFTGGLSISGRYFFGSITFIPAGPPCPAPTGVAATSVLSSTATLSWNPVSGSIGYEYLLDQLSTNPPGTATLTTTTNTSFNATGLTPSTTYWLHVRNKCTSTNKSPWVNYSFTTLPPCEPPIGFKVTKLDTNSATIHWNKWLSALSYDYIIDQNPDDPGGTTGAVNTADTFANLSGLTENTLYYVHIRSKCAAGQNSVWSLDSFMTPVPCRAPKLKIDHVNVHQAVTYWDPVASAQWYEYAITQMSIPPVLGTKYEYTSIHTSALNDGEEYFMHVRCKCLSVGVESMSPWATASFKTWPTSIANVNGNDPLSLDAYPNPVKEQVMIEVSGTRIGHAAIEIADVAGKVVRTVEVTSARTVINMAGLAPGVYMARYTDEAHTEIKKITKQ